MRILIMFLIMAAPAVYHVVLPMERNNLQDDIAKSMERGKEVYNLNCLGCHQASGEGLSGVYPPLAKSDHLAKDQAKSIDILLKGQSEEITVNGTKYSVPMIAFNNLTDEQIADVLNYIGNSWGNKLNAVTSSQVKSKRD